MKYILLMIVSVGCLHAEELIFDVYGYSNYVYVVTIAGTKVESVELAEISYNLVMIVPQTSKYKDGSFNIVCDLTVKGATALANLKGSVVFNGDGTVCINNNVGRSVPKGFVRRK